MSKSKKHLQLGMNPSTARSRLRSDILFAMAVAAGNKCHHCKKDLDRETFTIEHIEPWLDSENPVEKYFNLSNIAFSHLACNSGAARPARHNKVYENEAERYEAQKKRKRDNYCPKKRRKMYLEKGH